MLLFIPNECYFAVSYQNQMHKSEIVERINLIPLYENSHFLALNWVFLPMIMMLTLQYIVSISRFSQSLKSERLFDYLDEQYFLPPTQKKIYTHQTESLMSHENPSLLNFMNSNLWTSFVLHLSTDNLKQFVRIFSILSCSRLYCIYESVCEFIHIYSGLLMWSGKSSFIETKN